jgi:hypothetical protein
MASLQIVFHYRATGSHAVSPVDLFAFCISPTAVGNAHLVDPTAHSGEFGGNFRLKTEMILLDLDMSVSLRFVNIFESRSKIYCRPCAKKNRDVQCQEI